MREWTGRSNSPVSRIPARVLRRCRIRPVSAAIDDYDAWEAALLEEDDVIGYIERGSLVPICIDAEFDN